MNLINKVRSFLVEEEFKINLYKNKINLINYYEIIHFDEFKVIIDCPIGKVVVDGKDLIVSKLLSNEVLIEGKINKLELR